MAWYSIGTVAVTLNSPTVTGTGTTFSANVRVGDAFRGPDGRWYEVTNVASSTVISIKPNYQGSTASGQPYAVAPILGYDKDLSDRFNLIASQWGTTLASVQPWALSPTGSEAMDSMGFTTIGKALAVAGSPQAGRAAIAAIGPGDYGWGGNFPNAPASLNDLSVTGLYSTSASTTGVPIGQGTGQGQGYAVHYQHGNASFATQLWYHLNSNRSFVRTKVSGAWQAWSEILVSGNAPVADLNGVPSSGFYGVANGAANTPGLASEVGSGLLSTQYDTATEYQIYQYRVGNRLFARRKAGGTWQAWYELYTTANTTRATDGTLRAASPVVRIANVSQSERPDLQELDFEPAGDWAVANEEARGVSVVRLDVGVYRIVGSLGLATEGWRVIDPASPDGGRPLGITDSEQAEDGTVTIRLYKQRWTLSDDGEMVLGKGAPLDVPLNSWIDVRLSMPAPPDSLSETE
ncbi:pyocin knob domain-containing protein [Pseudomonas aeruginosa]|nr:pyocin knob domain-containing protein [Pseudomonas aeruginosa]MDI2352032.1 pyocin knob domain-containing protein [Pseudomonas aeruginosa]